MKPKRRHDGPGEMTIDIVLKDGSKTILEFREKKPSALEEVIEMLKRKL